MKTFCFTVDDNIRFLKELTEGKYNSIFDHPYLALYRRLHERYGLKVQLNLFYRTEGFDLSLMTEAYYDEFLENSDWLKMSFHSELENVRPYAFAPYEEVYWDCKRVHNEVARFASPSALARTTTLHYCVATAGGVKALEDLGVSGLLGLFGTDEAPRVSYQVDEASAARIRRGEAVKLGAVTYSAIDAILNNFSREEILARLASRLDRPHLKVMIHEQYFYPDYPKHQPDFEEKLKATFDYLTSNGYQSAFFEELL